MVELQAVWGWQPALYLFLGGVGAGAFVAASAVRLVDRGGQEKIVATSMWLSTAALVLGLLCLLTELTNPLRGLLLWQSFSNGGSWMTFGAWVVFAAVIVFGVSAVLAADRTAALAGRIWKPLERYGSRLLDALSVVGIALGFGVAVYTGLLLMSAPGVPLWNTWLLPVLFAVSAFDTGVALVEVVGVARSKDEELTARARKLLERSVVVLVVVEAAVLAALASSMLSGGGFPEDASGMAEAATASASLFVSGPLAPWFWILVAACGLALPLAAALVGLRSGDCGVEGRKGNGLVLAGAFGALAGGCALRFVIVLSGLHADVVGGTVAAMFADMLSVIGLG